MSKKKSLWEKITTNPKTLNRMKRKRLYNEFVKTKRGQRDILNDLEKFDNNLEKYIGKNISRYNGYTWDDLYFNRKKKSTPKNNL